MKQWCVPYVFLYSYVFVTFVDDLCELDPDAGNCPHSFSAKRGLLTSSYGTIFRVTGHLYRELTRHRLIPRIEASGMELGFGSRFSMYFVV